MANSYRVRLLVTGDHYAGKSSLIRRFGENTYTESWDNECMFVLRSFTLGGGSTITIEISEFIDTRDDVWQWDNNYINEAGRSKVDGVIVVYDLTSLVAFRQVHIWLSEIPDHIKLAY